MQNVWSFRAIERDCLIRRNTSLGVGYLVIFFLSHLSASLSFLSCFLSSTDLPTDWSTDLLIYLRAVVELIWLNLLRLV